MSAIRSQYTEFVNPFTPSDIIKANRWLARYNPDVRLPDYEIDENSMLVVGMTTFYDDEYPGLPDRDTALMNQWAAMRSGQCEICQMFPAKHMLHNVGDYIMAGVCDHCLDTHEDT